MGRPATAKKDRLIDAAMRRYHHDGVAASSIAAVARDAEVPAGNVFYYFRSKDALTKAVIDRWCDRVGAGLSLHEAHPDPRDRIRAFISSAGDRRQSYTDHGCPLAALGMDLRAVPGAVGAQSGRPLALVRNWLATQYTQVHGDPVAGQGQADFCITCLQGSFALAHAARDPAIVSNSVARLLELIGAIGKR